MPASHSDLASLAASWDYPVVVKPNTGSAGGREVAFSETPQELLSEVSGRSDFIVQPRLEQHPSLDRFNPAGLNTVRVYTYRSVSTGRVEVLNAALRMGRGGSLDNETAGGIVCSLAPDGRLNRFAVDKHASRFEEHPDTRVRFSEAGAIPNFTTLRDRARHLGSRLPMMRLAGWDFYLDRTDEWCCLEVNLAWHTIRFAQYAGQPFFGPFTEEVRDFCAAHPLVRRAVWRVA
jgi:hypothetical protein